MGGSSDVAAVKKLRHILRRKPVGREDSCIRRQMFVHLKLWSASPGGCSTSWASSGSLRAVSCAREICRNALSSGKRDRPVLALVLLEFFTIVMRCQRSNAALANPRWCSTLQHRYALWVRDQIVNPGPQRYARWQRGLSLPRYDVFELLSSGPRRCCTPLFGPPLNRL